MSEASITIYAEETCVLGYTYSKDEFISILDDLDAKELEKHGLFANWKNQPMTKEHLIKIYNALEEWMREDCYRDYLDSCQHDNHNLKLLDPHFETE